MILGLLCFLSGVFAQDVVDDCFASALPRGVLVADNHAEFYSLDPYVECGEWSVWISAGSSCTSNTPRCVLFTGGHRLEDLCRTRTCHDTLTYDTYQQTEFKTAGAGCCGDL